MKSFYDIKSRTPCIIFIKGKGRDMVEEWSKERSPTFARLDGTTISNPNQKIFKINSILTTDWSTALRWNTKYHKIIKSRKKSNIYCTSDTIKIFQDPNARQI
jgi:hypothetical protein